MQPSQARKLTWLPSQTQAQKLRMGNRLLMSQGWELTLTRQKMVSMSVKRALNLQTQKPLAPNTQTTYHRQGWSLCILDGAPVTETTTLYTSQPDQRGQLGDICEEPQEKINLD